MTERRQAAGPGRRRPAGARAARMSPEAAGSPFPSDGTGTVEADVANMADDDVSTAEAAANAGEWGARRRGARGGRAFGTGSLGPDSVDADGGDADGAGRGPAAGTADPAEQARQVCLRLLTLGPRTRAQLTDALRKKGIPEETADEVLSRFEGRRPDR